jgi:hypothetical protein
MTLLASGIGDPHAVDNLGRVQLACRWVLNAHPNLGEWNWLSLLVDYHSSLHLTPCNQLQKCSYYGATVAKQERMRLSERTIAGLECARSQGRAVPHKIARIGGNHGSTLLHA